LQTRYGVEFEDYFIGELKDLREFEREGFVTWESTGLTVLPLGQIFVRNIAMAFDTSLKGKGAPPERFSRTV